MELRIPVENIVHPCGADSVDSKKRVRELPGSLDLQFQESYVQYRSIWACWVEPRCAHYRISASMQNIRKTEWDAQTNRSADNQHIVSVVSTVEIRPLLERMKEEQTSAMHPSKGDLLRDSSTPLNQFPLFLQALGQG